MICLLCLQNYSVRRKMIDYLLMKEDKDSGCKQCMSKFEKVNQNLCCQRCQKKGMKKICDDCISWEKRGVIIQHRTIYYYNDAMKDYFKQYKFQGDYLLKSVFSDKLRKLLLNYKDYQIITVPVNQETFERRQFNQIQSILEDASIPFIIPFKKIENNIQSKKNKMERINNNNYQFDKEYYGKIRKKVIIVDDIYTTGATIFHLSKILKVNGAKIIRSVSIAR